MCAALLGGHASWFTVLRLAPPAERQGWLVTGLILLAQVVVVMIVLLATTPRDAIRLPRRRSEWLIAAGAIFLQLAAILITGDVFPLPSARRAIGAAVVVGATVLLLWWLRRGNRSAWWAAVFGWNPLIVTIAVLGRVA